MKILIIKLNKIGDVLLSSPLFYNLKEHFKTCSIDMLVNNGTQDIINTQYIRKIHILKRSPSPHLRLKNEISLLFALKKESYDLVLGLTGGDRTAFLSFWSGAKLRIGFKPNNLFRYCYTHTLSYQRHIIESHCNFLKILDIPILSKAVLPPIPLDSSKLSCLPSKFFHLHLMSDWFFKTLSDEFCARLIDFLYQTYAIPCVLTTSSAKKEIDKLNKILILCHNKPLSFSDLSLREVTQLNSKSLAFIGVDTAIMHLSAANDIPSFAFFGPSPVQAWGIWDNTLQHSTYTQKNGIQRMGKHCVYQESLDCVPCGLAGCNGSQKSDCLLNLLQEEKALQTLKDFLDPLCS